MKFSVIALICFILTACSSTELVDTWKNPDIDTYAPSKVLIVGLSSNRGARQKFEHQLKEKLELRNAEAVASLEFFKTTFDTENITERELNTLEEDLIKDGFDTILFTKVIGVEDKIVYRDNYALYDETYTKFKEDYLRYQDVFYNPEYYEQYTIYHAETSMYCICPTKDRELIWKGYVDIVDPRSVDTTVSDYVKLVIAVLEELKLINPEVIVETEAPIQ